MTESSVNESILNIKTFHGYLEHIINSIEIDNYHEPTITKISEMITTYYDDINQENDNSDDEGSLTTIIDSTKTNDSENESSDSDTSDEEDSEKTTSSLNSLTKNMIKKDEYLLNFLENRFENQNIEVYKNPFFENRLDSFLNSYTEY